MAGSAFINRLRKNLAHRRKWAARAGLTAFRVYDQDIPEYRFSVDCYPGHAYLVEWYRHGGEDAQRREVFDAVCEALELAPERVHTRTRAPKPWGQAQYQKLAATGQRVEVAEGGLKFLCNLDDYLDTGLFLDHRRTRDMVRTEARGRRVLNLFCYTGSFTVYAAAGGAAATTSVDLSNTYLDWARDNLALNGLAGPDHALVRADATRWLATAGREAFDLVVLDPPSFSSSKAMEGTLDIQRDHAALLRDALRALAPAGVLYFSTNFTGFTLDPAALDGTSWRELTPGSIPEDIRNRKVHRCWRAVR